MTTKEELFVQQILEHRDELYRETSRLKSQLSSFENFGSERSSYQQQLEENKQTIIKKEQTINQLDETVSKLKQQIEMLQRKIWGKSSERYINEDPLQRKLDFDGVDLLPEEKELATSAKEEIEKYKTIRVVEVKETKHPARKPLPESLPREETHIYPENINPGSWTELAPEITEVLEREPSRWYVRRIIRHKYALKDKSQDIEKQVITAPMPALPIAKSYAGATVLADIIIDKYVNHLPFYRQIEMFKQQGISIAPATINGWFQNVADLLRPTYYRLKELVLDSDYIQSDETTIPIINNEKHTTIKGYIWMIRAVMGNLVFFHYDHGSRSQKVALQLFKDFQGVIQTDGYAVYDIYEHKKGVLPIGCCHARRYFEEALKEDKVRASYALEQIGLLYDVERQADQQQLSYDQRAELRSRLAYPIMVAFEKWLLNEYPKVLPKGRIGKAIRYTYNIYHKLTRYHLDGRLKIDNNLGENAIRPIALGRKNWLFCGNHGAAENAAIMYSMLGCCKAHEVNFRDWLVYFLNNIHRYDTDYSKDLAELLPHNFKPANQ